MRSQSRRESLAGWKSAPNRWQLRLSESIATERPLETGCTDRDARIPPLREGIDRRDTHSRGYVTTMVGCYWMLTQEGNGEKNYAADDSSWVSMSPLVIMRPILGKELLYVKSNRENLFMGLFAVVRHYYSASWRETANRAGDASSWGISISLAIGDPRRSTPFPAHHATCSGVLLVAE